MDSLQRLPEVRKSIEAAFGSLETPDYHFVEVRYRTLVNHDFLRDLIQRYFVKDDTDLNNDLSLHLRVWDGENSLAVCLSFVDPWAMAFRLGTDRSLHVSVLDDGSVPSNPMEAEFQFLLRKHGLALVTKSEAASRFAMKLFATDDHEVCLYHALFADTGCTMQVLL